jgi:hypothetical protein
LPLVVHAARATAATNAQSAKRRAGITPTMTDADSRRFHALPLFVRCESLRDQRGKRPAGRHCGDTATGNGTIFERSAPLFRVLLDTGVLIEHGAGSAMTSDAALDSVVGLWLVVVVADCFPPLEQPATSNTAHTTQADRVKRLALIRQPATPVGAGETAPVGIVGSSVLGLV